MAGRKKGPANPYDAYRAEAYANVAAANRGRIPDLEDVWEEIKRLTPSVAVSQANDAAAWLAVQTEDGIRTNPPPWESQLWLPGWPEPPSGFWKVGDGERVRIADATAADHVAHLKLIEENERAVIDAARLVRQHYYALEPYYRTGSGSVADAVARWQADHP